MELAVFATATRYPGDYEPVKEEEYREALAMAETIYQWVVSVLKSREGQKND